MLIFVGLFGTSFIQKVGAGQKGMREHHPRAAVAHNLDNPLFHSGFVAVNAAGAAGRLVLLKNAVSQAFGCIVVQLTAGQAKLTAFSMMSAAEDGNHGSDRFEFTLQAGMQRRGLRMLFGVHCGCF
jgi:hypothetical protein